MNNHGPLQPLLKHSEAVTWWNRGPYSLALVTESHFSNDKTRKPMLYLYTTPEWSISIRVSNLEIILIKYNFGKEALVIS